MRLMCEYGGKNFEKPKKEPSGSAQPLMRRTIMSNTRSGILKRRSGEPKLPSETSWRRHREAMAEGDGAARSRGRSRYVKEAMTWSKWHQERDGSATDAKQELQQKKSWPRNFVRVTTERAVLGHAILSQTLSVLGQKNIP